MERQLNIKEEDLGTSRGLLMRNVIFNWHGNADGTHILDICEDESKFKNLASIFFEYARKQRIDFSGTFSNGVGRIRIGKKRRSIAGMVL